MNLAIETPGLLSLAAGFTDNATLPALEVGEVATELARREGSPEFLQYGMNQGRPGLRGRLADRLCVLEPELDRETLLRSTFVTNGSQQALYLAMQVLCDPGDVVLVDRPSYFVFLEMLAGLGIQARSIPVDTQGKVDGEGLKALLAEMRVSGQAERLRAVYFVSYFSNPSARSLERREKDEIAEALSAAGVVVPVIEDAAYRELYFERPETAPSILTSAAWAAFPRLYLSTLTKPFATGLKVGYGVCTDEAWLKKMLHVKGHHDFGTANFNQAVFERVLASGGFDRQLEKVRKVYQQKREALEQALLAQGLQDLGWSWARPEGGLYLWLKAPTALDTRLDSAFCRSCIANGVVYVPGDLCFGDDAPHHYARLSFGVLSVEELAEAGKRFVATARDFT